MNKEVIKTIVLTFLVISSVFLTWSIWTYSPNIESIPTKLIPEVAISNKKDISDIIKPSLVLFHDDDNIHGSTADDMINMALNQMSSWTFYDFKKVSSNLSTEKYESYMNKTGITELVFSDSIPFALYKKEVIVVEDRETRRDLEFDRIFFGPGSNNADGNEVYFVSTEKKYMYKFSVSTADIKNLTITMRQKAKNMSHYTTVPVSNGRSIYVPENSQSVKKFKYYARELNVNKFKNALFADPSVVKSDKTLTGKEFTDGSTIMHISEDPMTLEYVKPSLRRDYSTASMNLLENSIDFINEHSGWEDNYRFAEMNHANQETIFRLYVEGLPVFNNQGMSELVQHWVEDDLYEYKRPYFSLQFDVGTANESISLASGKEVYQAIKKTQNFDPELFENMSIGYEMIRDFGQTQSSVLIRLEPAWFYKYNGKWSRFIPDQTGGVVSGLE